MIGHKLYFLFLLIFSFCNLHAYNSSYKYFLGRSEPDSSWMNVNFNDSLWYLGEGSIGFGDDDDDTQIDEVNAIYLRSSLHILADEYRSYAKYVYQYNLIYFNNPLDSVSYIEYIEKNMAGLLIYADYDDGFIAYINGKEVLRVNISDSVLYPGYKYSASRPHEATGYRNLHRELNSFYISTEALLQCDIDTSSVLAFQVLNYKEDSDMTFDFKTKALGSDYSYNFYGDKFIQPVELDSTNLPIVFINTDEYGVGEDKITAQMSVYYANAGGMNQVSNTVNYGGRISMKRRGKTSYDFPKASYTIETQDSLGENLNVSLLGMPPENDWVLYGPFSDRSLIRNELVFSIGRKMGYYEPRTRFCELVLNGVYRGLYVLTEKIKRDKNRVNIAKLKPTENSGNSLTGGYIFKYDKDNPSNYDFEIIYPKSDEITNTQATYITQFFKGYESVLKSNLFLDSERGYKKYINDTSLVDYILINEFSKNIDSYYYSCYLYKDRTDRDGRIHFGPLWDYDFSFGYSLWYDIPTTGWMWEEREKLHLKRILQDTVFTSLLVERWHNYRKNIFKLDTLMLQIDVLEESIHESIETNYLVWPIMPFYWYSYQSENMGLTYPEEIANLKSWIYSRLSWIDNNIEDIYYPLHIYDTVSLVSNSVLSKISCYPNPVVDVLNIDMQVNSLGNYKADLYNTFGIKCQNVFYEYLSEGANNFKFQFDEALAPGIYFLVIYYNESPIKPIRVIKSN